MRFAAVLQSVDIFSHLTPDDLERFAERMVERTLMPNDVLYRQGASPDCMAVVVSGSIELTQSTDGRPSASQHVRAGEACGDVALFSGEPYAATATALEATRVLVLLKDDFEGLVSSRPAIMRSVLATISRRVAQVNRELVTEQSDGASDVANGRIIGVFSPRGGAGKTTIAINLALQFASTQPGRVALLDLDLLFDDAAFLLDVTPTASLAQVPERDLQQLDTHMPGSLLADYDGRLRVLTAATRPEDGERVTGAHVRAALAALRRHFAITVVDCGSGLAEPALVSLELSDRVVVVCTPDLASLRDVRDCQRILGQALHLERQRLTYCFNHPLPAVGLTQTQFASALEQPLTVDIPHAGQPRPIRTAHSGFTRAIDRLATELQPVAAKTGSSARPARLRRLPFWHHG